MRRCLGITVASWTVVGALVAGTSSAAAQVRILPQEQVADTVPVADPVARSSSSSSSSPSASEEARPTPTSTPETPAATAPRAQPAPSATLAAAAAPSAPPQHSEAACLLGAHDGIDEADARTSTALVCGALRDKGAQVGTEPIGASEAYGYSAAYRVALRPLGKLVVLHVSYESPVGRELRSRRLQLGKIEEMTVAAPRMADALLSGRGLAETAKVDNLVGEETRTSLKQSGETFFAIGVLGFSLPDEAWAGYGAIARFHYETARYAISIDGRIGGSARTDGDAHLYGLAVGARYFLSDADVAPYLGGGLGVLWIGVNETFADPDYDYEDHRERDGSGLAPFAEAGIELLRMHDSRLDLGLRLDVPLYRLEGGGKSYVLPVSLLAAYSFD